MYTALTYTCWRARITSRLNGDTRSQSRNLTPTDKLVSQHHLPAMTTTVGGGDNPPDFKLTQTVPICALGCKSGETQCLVRGGRKCVEDQGVTTKQKKRGYSHKQRKPRSHRGNARLLLSKGLLPESRILLLGPLFSPVWQNTWGLHRTTHAAKGQGTGWLWGRIATNQSHQW